MKHINNYIEENTNFSFESNLTDEDLSIIYEGFLNKLLSKASDLNDKVSEKTKDVKNKLKEKADQGKIEINKDKFKKALTTALKSKKDIVLGLAKEIGITDNDKLLQIASKLALSSTGELTSEDFKDKEKVANAIEKIESDNTLGEKLLIGFAYVLTHNGKTYKKIGMKYEDFAKNVKSLLADSSEE